MDTQVPTVAAVSPIFKAARNSERSANEHWWIASYSSLKTRGIQNSGLPANADSSRTPDIARDDQVMEESAAVAADNAVSQPSFSRQNPGLHGFYRGPEPGTFLHGLLEWCAETGFANAATNAAQRRNEITGACELRGWQQEVDRLDDWLAGFVNTPFHLPALPQQAPVILNLCELDSWQAELEFLFAAHELHTADLDRLCQIYLLPAQARPALQASQLNGMIKGFIDLVFLDKGRYYVADWKSNYLGAADADYTAAAIETEVLNKRYDVQYAIYLLALHRLLSSRLTNYDYDVHVGGAVYFFLRGWQSPTQGLLVDKPPRAFMDALNQLFLTGTLPAQLGTDTTKQVQHV
jgi:exodeoxyribonuclease V beta subunit